jgi:hypothetical protein
MVKKDNNNELEVINGVRFINGYMCDDSGRPITITNGYSEEDEREAAEAYSSAKETGHKASKKLRKNYSYEFVKRKKRNMYVAPAEDERWK